jgi:hypothetical protein
MVGRGAVQHRQEMPIFLEDLSLKLRFSRMGGGVLCSGQRARPGGGGEGRGRRQTAEGLSPLSSTSTQGFVEPSQGGSYRAELVLDDGDLHAMVAAQDVVDQRGLAGAEKPRHDCHGDLLRLKHLLILALVLGLVGCLV